ncbi:hypothetical protein VTK73DRAFT_9333 [Phialemonium thermophilum]|uniref:EKC/KEOPS complex subunit BUD32 n=1 Tax=Phialemonium thermophilum TaxID=223376 RepID=A0ABR3W2T1_9PEZI
MEKARAKEEVDHDAPTSTPSHDPEKATEHTTKKQPVLVGCGSVGSIELSPCGTRVIKTARPGSSKRSHKFNMRAILREWDVYLRIPPHPRILQFYSLAATPTSASITLEYKKNGNLRDYLARHPDQTLLQRMQWCVQATEGLYVLHRSKVVHSDLRPDNLLVADDLTLCIIDFSGSAVEGAQSLVAESRGYFLPRADWETTPDTDRFALGSCFYHIMTGRDPYHDVADPDQIDAEFARGAYPADVHDLLIGSVIIKCWRCEYASTLDVYHDLCQFQDRFQ